jgi:hypothetical protein
MQSFFKDPPSIYARFDSSMDFGCSHSISQFLIGCKKKAKPDVCFPGAGTLKFETQEKNIIETVNLLLVLCIVFLNLKLILFMSSFGLLGHFVILGFVELDEETLKNVVLLFLPEFGILKLIDLLNQLLIFQLVLFNDTFSSLECELVVMKLLFQRREGLVNV